ncbi:hypothetical protein AAFC00_003345 [Neodothiora populina]
MYNSASNTDLLRDGTGPPDDDRPTGMAQKHLYRGCASLQSIVVLALSLYSTIMSGLWLVIAIKGPRWSWIGSHGSISSANANLLVTIFAKTIELSFVTVFVSFIGQFLWRRAHTQPRHGITLAEVDLRSWVMQPMKIFAHLFEMRLSVISVPSVVTFAAAFVALLYTTASVALVQPRLKFGDWEAKTMHGLVKTSWANIQYLQDQCESPNIPYDETDGPSTCVQIEMVSQALHNYQRYLTDWASYAKSGNGSSLLSERPQAFALLTENTTVTGQWIEITETNATVLDGRVVNNVSMAMPHSGVTTAARDVKNGILQPEDLDGLGIYSLNASIWSPAINVLCANMREHELEPIVYANFSNGDDNFQNVSTNVKFAGISREEYMKNKTVVDDLFGWGEKYDQTPPIFGKFPENYNTILNHTGNYGRNAIYLLGRKEDEDEYLLCSIKAYITPLCKTTYRVTSAHAYLRVDCETGDQMQYSRQNPNANSGNATVSKDWVEGAHDWGNSISLDDGLINGNASNARLLTQLMLPNTSSSLQTKLPSPAEALAVMAGCTIVMGTQDAQFNEYFNYTSASHNMLQPGQYEDFKVLLQAQQYASGGTLGNEKGIFFLVLALLFVLNILCLSYLISKRGLITDFSEPLNLFSLALNSPETELMKVDCEGPKGKYFVPWRLMTREGHVYIEPKTDEEGHEMVNRRYRDSWNPVSPVKWAYKRLSNSTNASPNLV